MNLNYEVEKRLLYGSFLFVFYSFGLFWFLGV